MSVAGGGPWEGMKGVKLSKPTMSYITEKLRFTNMAPVQARTIPLLLSHHDVVVEAITGSGKTLAYLIPCVEFLVSQRCQEVCRINKAAVIGVIILPSRELAQQVHEHMSHFLTYLSTEWNKNAAPAQQLPIYHTQCFIGGRAIEVDVNLIQTKGAHVLIGTPGRMYELLVSSKYASLFNLGHLELVILDEADKLLEFGFKAKLDALLKRFPKQRRTGLFSATQTKELGELARAGMRNPVSVSVRVATVSSSGENAQKPQIPEQLTNYFAVAKYSEKLDRLIAFLKLHANEKIIIYVMTCAAVDWMYLALSQVLLNQPNDPKKFNIQALHGQMTLPQRQKVHENVTKAKSCVLVCTDVAARGLDIPSVGQVVQFDPPVDPHTFVHRIGRTGRMGKQGTSLVFVLPQEVEYVPFLKLQNIPLLPLDEAIDSLDKADEVAGDLDTNRTLASSAKKITRVNKLLSRAERRKELFDAKQKEAKDSARARKRSVTGDMCESPSVLALRRAARVLPDLVSLAARAFVSFIRAYKEHECRYIFQLKKIDLTDLTHSFGLFKIPNCGEIRHMNMLKVPIQEEFNDILQKLTEDRKRKREEEEKRREEEAAEAEMQDDGSDLKKHRTERAEHLEELKKNASLSKAERNRQWKQEEIREIMRDAYYVKKEKRGFISGRVVDEKMSVDHLENAMMSTRERNESKKIREKRK